MLYLIGVTEHGDTVALKADEASEDQLATLFEEYSNQGLFMLRDVVQSSVSPLDDIMTIILEKASTPVFSPMVADLI